MTMKKTIALSAVTAALLTFTGCGEEDTATTTTSTATVSGTVVTITGDITTNTSWSADNKYELKGLVKVKNNAVLTIAPGTTVFGDAGSNYMVVTKGAKLNAEGNATHPIIFTSKAALLDPTKAASGQWGGLTILGDANTNQTAPFYEVDESDTDFAFGGDNNASNSGILKYVQILNSGYAVATDKEINGLSLCGVGTGTTVDHVFVQNSADDCIEIWGGTVNVSNLTMINCGDDIFDLDFGYNGTAKNIFAVQTEAAHAGFEISSGGTTPMTSARIENFVITKVAGSDEGGIYIKDDTTAPTFVNGMIYTVGSDAALFLAKNFGTGQEAALGFKDVNLTGSATSYGAKSGVTSTLQTRHVANDAN